MDVHGPDGMRTDRGNERRIMAQSGVYSRYGKNGKAGLRGEDILTVKEVCDLLRCGKTHVYNMINCGKLKKFQIGEKRGIRIYAKDVERIMEEPKEE
jgi:excisionase family DNA binding protein